MYRDVLKEWSVEVDVEKPKQTYHYICFYIFFTFYFGFKEYKPWNKNKDGTRIRTKYKNIASAFYSLSKQVTCLMPVTTEHHTRTHL